MTQPGSGTADASHGRRTRLQARLEDAVGRGELSINDYEDLCARVWDAGHDDDSQELDAIAGRLERLEAQRREDAASSFDPAKSARATNPHRQSEPDRPRPVDSATGDAAPGGAAAGGMTDGHALVGRTSDSERQDGRPVVFSDKKIEGRWAPKATTTWWGLFGDVTLDLRQADWPDKKIVLDFQSALSNTKVIVPPGTVIVDDTTAILADVSIKTCRTTPANGLTVVLDGILMMSEVKVRDR